MFDEIRPRGGRDGQEARTALPVTPRAKGLLAAAGALFCLSAATLAWWWGAVMWVPIVLLLLALWAVGDVVWQWYRHRKNRRRPRHSRANTPRG